MLKPEFRNSIQVSSGSGRNPSPWAIRCSSPATGNLAWSSRVGCLCCNRLWLSPLHQILAFSSFYFFQQINKSLCGSRAVHTLNRHSLHSHETRFLLASRHGGCSFVIAALEKGQVGQVIQSLIFEQDIWKILLLEVDFARSCSSVPQWGCSVPVIKMLIQEFRMNAELWRMLIMFDKNETTQCSTISFTYEKVIIHVSQTESQDRCQPIL